MKKLVLVLPLLLLAGCTSIERSAYNTAVASKKFLDSVKASHSECVPANSAALCVGLRKATAAKDLLVDAGEAYCGGPQFDTGGACQPPQKGTPQFAQAVDKLKTALAGYSQTEKDLRGLL